MTLGRLHVFNLSLGAGAMGLYWFYGRVFAGAPGWIVVAALVLPWLTVHVITFCNEPPFGPVPFRRCLLAAVCAYASLAAGAEGIQLVYRLPPDGGFTLVAARVFMSIGCLGCIPLARAYLELRGFGSEDGA
jgi:hypothetical protein